MLLDTKKLHTVQEAPEDLDYCPSEHERDKRVFVFRMTWDGDDEGDILNFADALDFITTFDVEGEERMTEKEGRELLYSQRTFRIGTDEDWYLFSPLPEPMTHDHYGELVALDDLVAA